MSGAQTIRAALQPLTCQRHRSYWSASCRQCRTARANTLATVQSCTVCGALHASELDVRCVQRGA